MKKKLLNLLLVTAMAVGVSGFIPNEVEAGYDTEIQAFKYEDYYIPAYDGDIYEVVNNNDPLFDDDEMVTTAFEEYSNLDSFGRCGVAYANICQEIMPTEERGDIGSVKPTGWVQAKYDFVDGKYLYNRCHLIGFQLAGENANTKNLITGTRSLNNDGMLPFENDIADYVEETGNHVLYRVTPIFEDDNLLASGVLMEADSVEDDGIEFCVFVYNVQDGVSIDYATGESRLTSEINDELYNIKNADITLKYTSYTYNGSYKKPTVTVKMNGKTLVKNTDYEVSYSNNKNVGTGLVTITGIGEYTGSTKRSFKINARDIDDAAFSSVSNKTYTGKQIKPSVTVKYNSKTLVKGTDYTITYGTNKSIGKGILTVKGKGNYKGSKQISFKIVPKKPSFSSTSAKKTSIYVKWSKATGATKYQIAYRKYGNSTYKYKTTSNNYLTLSGLSSGKYYQVKVRAYKTVNGNNYYSSWSSVKKIKTLKSSSSSGTTSTTNKTSTVYTTETGKKYHCTKNCSGLSNAKKIYTDTLSEAKTRGLTPCSKCY